MKFSDIPGQEALKQRLKNTIKEQRISHAQLFMGPEGNGKLALAIAYAQYINCPNRTEEDSCGLCPSCRQFEKLAHPDLHFIFPTVKKSGSDKRNGAKDYMKEWREFLRENQSIISLPAWYEKMRVENKQGVIYTDDAQDVIRALSYKSFESEYRIVIIWMIEKLHHDAAPKLLKILEEPPSKTLFLLITEQAEQILSTIKSRTQLVKIPALDETAMKQWLEKQGETDPEHILHTIAMTDGNIVAARNFLGDEEEDSYNFKTFRDWMRLCFQTDIKGINDLGASFSKIGRERQKTFYAYALKIVRFAIHLHLKNNQLIKSGKTENDFLKKFSPFFNGKNIMYFAEEFNKAIHETERNANALILFLDISLKASQWLRMK